MLDKKEKWVILEQVVILAIWVLMGKGAYLEKMDYQVGEMKEKQFNLILNICCYFIFATGLPGIKGQAGKYILEH